MRRAAWIAFVLLATVAVAEAQAPPAPEAGAPSGIVQGTVIVKRHAPVVGAAVLLRPQGDGNALDVTSTDAKGAFKLDAVSDGAYRLEIVRDGFKSVVKEDVAVRAPFRAVVEIVLEPDSTPKVPTAAGTGGATPIRVSGSAIAQDNGTKAEVRLRLARVGVDEPRTVLTDPDGSFAVDGLTAGRFRLDVLGAGYIPIRVWIDLRADTRIRARLVPQPPNYAPEPEDLMPPEEPIPPPARGATS